MNIEMPFFSRDLCGNIQLPCSDEPATMSKKLRHYSAIVLFIMVNGAAQAADMLVTSERKVPQIQIALDDGTSTVCHTATSLALAQSIEVDSQLKPLPRGLNWTLNVKCFALSLASGNIFIHSDHYYLAGEGKRSECWVFNPVKRSFKTPTADCLVMQPTTVFSVQALNGDLIAIHSSLEGFNVLGIASYNPNTGQKNLDEYTLGMNGLAKVKVIDNEIIIFSMCHIPTAGYCDHSLNADAGSFKYSWSMKQGLQNISAN